jgi:serine/threonine protein kinase
VLDGYLVVRDDGKFFFPIIDNYHSADLEQLISLIWGLNFHIFKPTVPADHEEYELEILMKHCQHFGPYPLSYEDFADLETQNVLAHVMNTVGGATSGKDMRKPFYLTGEAEISKEDKDFLGKMMLLDPRDRPTATELLGDEWFMDPGDDFPSGNRST